MRWHPDSKNWRLAFILIFFDVLCAGVARTGRLKCVSQEDMPWRIAEVFRQRKQSDMVAQFTNVVLLHGIFCDGLSSNSERSCLCFPMANVASMLYQRTSSILRSCGEPRACANRSFKHSKMLPCGTLSYFTTGKARMPDHYLSVPSFHVVNITLWWLESRRIPHYKHPCLIQNLIFKDDNNEFYSNNVLDMQLCGTTWRENILSSTRRVRIIWENTAYYPEKSGFCLTYQPVAAWYSSMEDKSNIIENVEKESMMTRDDGNLLATTLFPSFFIKLSRGQTSTYILSYTGGVLEVPILRIHKFLCLSETDETKIDVSSTSLAMYDWPTFPFGNGFNMKRSLISEISCSDGASPVEFSSTMGDLTISILVSQYSNVIWNGTLSHTPLPCPGQFCNLSTLTVPNDENITFELSSKAQSRQQRMVLSVKEDNTGYIFLSNINVRFAGFTHYPCVFGGIFIYEFTSLSTEFTVDTKSVSLLAKICSPLMAQIWKRGMNYSSDILGLHFNVRPLLFVVKTYVHHSSSHIEGHASLSDCAGVVNFLFNPTPRQYDIPNRGLLIMPQKIEYHQLPRVRHQQGCLTIQSLLWGEDYNKALRSRGTTINITSIIKTRLPEHTIGSSSQPFFLPFHVYFRLHLCILQAYPIGVNFNNLGKIRPPRSGYELGFEYGCLVRGEMPFVTMTYPGDEISTECMTSERTEKFLLSDEEESIYYIPITLCAKLNVKGNMYVHDTFSKVYLLFSKPYTMQICCMLQMKINAKLSSLKNIIQLRMQENHEQYKQSETWWKIWKPKHILDENIFSGIVSDREVQLLGDGWKISSLFGYVVLIIELIRPISSFRPTRSILNISFNYSFWERKVDNMGKSESSARGNRYCTDGDINCYMLLNRNRTSWEDAKLICEKQGLALLSATSDFEWKRFEALIAHHKISQGVALAFLNLRYKQASLIATYIVERQLLSMHAII